MMENKKCGAPAAALVVDLEEPHPEERPAFWIERSQRLRLETPADRGAGEAGSVLFDDLGLEPPLHAAERLPVRGGKGGAQGGMALDQPEHGPAESRGVQMRDADRARQVIGGAPRRQAVQEPEGPLPRRKEPAGAGCLRLRRPRVGGP